MNLQDTLTALAAFVVVVGALIGIIKVIVQVTVAGKIDLVKQNTATEQERLSRRLNRIERRIAVLEIKVLGESNTFSGIG